MRLKNWKLDGACLAGGKSDLRMKRSERNGYRNDKAKIRKGRA